MGTELEQVRSPLTFNLVINKGLTIHTEGEFWRFATWALQSGMAPKSYTKPEQVIGAVMAGAELGLNALQSLRGIAMIGNAPCIWGDCRKGLVLASGQLTDYAEWFDGEDGPDEGLVAHCRMGRGVLTLTKSFNWHDAKRANLLAKDTYRNYLKDMLMNRARWRVQSALFSDRLGGMAPAELPEYHQEPTPVENEADLPPKTNKLAALVAKQPLPNGMKGVPDPTAEVYSAAHDTAGGDSAIPGGEDTGGVSENASQGTTGDLEPGHDDVLEPEPYGIVQEAYEAMQEEEGSQPASKAQQDDIDALKKAKTVAPRQFGAMLFEVGCDSMKQKELTASQAKELLVALAKLK